MESRVVERESGRRWGSGRWLGGTDGRCDEALALGQAGLFRAGAWDGLGLHGGCGSRFCFRDSIANFNVFGSVDHPRYVGQQCLTPWSFKLS